MSKLPEWARSARDHWRYRGQHRPPFAFDPGAGQESVWDYPRPPRIAPDPRVVVVQLGAVEVARTSRSLRVMETASPPTFYIPPDDIRMEYLKAAGGSSRCEWKGEAVYWNVVAGPLVCKRAAWSYPDPLEGFEAIRDYLSFYPAALECRVGDARARPQPGAFYGGWVTPEVIGPFKGEPGSGGW